MKKVIIWVEFENLLSIGDLSNKADLKITIEGDAKKVDIVSQMDLKSGYEFEFEEYGEYCVSLENEKINYKENFIFDKHTDDLEIVVP
ncbi:hypothetical protein [Saccharicrinis fermentans]|uniref:Uncharacterized protein n=1 Tax=Saccharicrinis fermentans DSM 9555 = JCM 21142 TaxID=869213 RepID=W7Y9I1_9BACT|nr:hypothetical protein [Saccharicrinis fermentans]GAF04158.1 hypothetical protein JCM21142_72854 [Saccharicrinis fermentans DSM 9555 = JCM 21142]